MKNILVVLGMVTTVLAHADGKAYQYIFDKKISERACYAHAGKVAHVYGLTLLGANESGDHPMANSEGDIGGVAYYGEGTCHVYVF